VIDKIETDEEYYAALQMIDSLMDTLYNQDKLNMLVDLVVEYEEEHYNVRQNDDI
jgi:antitoxin component HigA of HigAB toxin-antitoxin module